MNRIKHFAQRVGLIADSPRKLATLETAVATMARNNLELARQVQELHRRLAHHEAGPLAGSKRDLDKARGNGVSRIIRV